MSRQYDESLEECFEYRGERHWLVRPKTRDEWLKALETRDMLKEEWSMLMHDEDDSYLVSLMQIQDEYIREYRDSIEDFHNGTLSKNIAFLLKSNSLKVSDLECVLGLSAGYISRTAKENSGKKLSIDVVWKLARLFNVNVDKLIGIDLSKTTGNMGLLFNFMDKLQHQTESVEIEWYDLGGPNAKRDFDKGEMEKLFVKTEDEGIRYLVPGWNPDVKFMLTDDVIGTYDIHEGKQLVVVPFRSNRDTEKGIDLMSRVHYDFLLVGDNGEGMKRVFNSGDYPFGDLDACADTLYRVAREHIMDVPLSEDMREFITGYLDKTGE